MLFLFLCYALCFKFTCWKLLAIRSSTKLTPCYGHPVSIAGDSDSAVRRLHLDQQLAKARSFWNNIHIVQVSFLFSFNRRADIERGLLMEGAELLEPLLSSKLSKAGISRFVVAREWAKVLRAEGVIRINNCFSAATGLCLSQHKSFFNLILLLLL